MLRNITLLITKNPCSTPSLVTTRISGESWKLASLRGWQPLASPLFFRTIAYYLNVHFFLSAILTACTIYETPPEPYEKEYVF